MLVAPARSLKPQLTVTQILLRLHPEHADLLKEEVTGPTSENIYISHNEQLSAALNHHCWLMVYHLMIQHVGNNEPFYSTKYHC